MGKRLYMLMFLVLILVLGARSQTKNSDSSSEPTGESWLRNNANCIDTGGSRELLIQEYQWITLGKSHTQHMNVL